MSASILRSILKRGWYFSELPGYREHPDRFRTYSLFHYDDLPPIEEEGLEVYDWLKRDCVKKCSLLEGMYPDGTKPDLSKLAEFKTHIDIPLPVSLVTFIDSEELRGRVRSCTDCYLDLGDYVVQTTGAEDGYLIHFLSDSQWILHWYLYVSKGGDHFILVSENGFGFNFDEQDFSIQHGRGYRLRLDQEEIWFCADSFPEFIYRFWLENEIWFCLTLDPKPLTDFQRRYVDCYRKRS
jgi:hypothetical protein